jgi:hypothetical protein
VFFIKIAVLILRGGFFVSSMKNSANHRALNASRLTAEEAVLTTGYLGYICQMQIQDIRKIYLFIFSQPFN